MGAPYISLDDLNCEAAFCSADDFKKLLKTYSSSYQVTAMQNATSGWHYNDCGSLYQRFDHDDLVEADKKKQIMIDYRAGVGEFARRPGPFTRLFDGLAARLSEPRQVRELKETVAALTARLEEVEKKLGPAQPGPSLAIKL